VDFEDVESGLDVDNILVYSMVDIRKLIFPFLFCDVFLRVLKEVWLIKDVDELDPPDN
jgi:hypothetical protein